MKKARAPTQDVDVVQLEALLARIERVVVKEDHEIVAALVGTLLEVQRLLREGARRARRAWRATEHEPRRREQRVGRGADAVARRRSDEPRQ